LSPFYEALLERDEARAREAAGELSGHDLFLAVTRFAVLAFAPSQHAKHALLSCLSTYELREELGPRYDAALVECALYAAASRQPWSEPPLMEPPSVPGPEGFGDRLSAERWLAAHADDPHAYFSAAAHDFEDLGHALIVATAAWKLAPLLGEPGRFATLRTGVWEMVATRGPEWVPGAGFQGPATLPLLAEQLIAACEGDVVSAHSIFLLDAALECGDAEVLRRTMSFLIWSAVAKPPLSASRHESGGLAAALHTRPSEVPVYNLAKDYGATLKAHAIAKRWRQRFPSIDVDAFVATVEWNRVNGPSMDEWSFA
jgi:hypothetical protein